MIVALYSTRIVLNALGASDYGIFNLIGGVIAMLSFLNAAMATSTQRYMSFYLGTGNSKMLASIFRTSVLLHFVIGIIIVILLELAGFYIFDDFLNIPINRIDTAKIVFHLMVISIFFTINAVPYDAAINAHEDMPFDAIIGILESILKLLIAVCIMYTHHEKIIIYTLLLTSLTIFIRVVKSLFCTTQYKECRLKSEIKIETKLTKEMFAFAGWNMFGALCGLGRSQGLGIILNLFFGPIVNAAYGIANQVNSQLYAFSENMLKALRPQIIKSEGSGERDRMLKLSMKASKYGFFLLAIFAIPLIIEMPFVLKLWLNNVPKYTILFCQLVLVTSLINLSTIGLQTAIQATGKIRIYQSVVGGLLLLNLPLAWMLLKFGFSAYSILVTTSIIELLACVFRIYILKKVTGMSISFYLIHVILRIVIPLSITLACMMLFYNLKEDSLIRLLFNCSLSSIIFLSSIYAFGLDKEEKKIIQQHVFKYFFRNTY